MTLNNRIQYLMRILRLILVWQSSNSPQSILKLI